MDQLDQFQLDRQSGLGSTDSAAILGRSPWAGPYSVWLDKIGQTPPREPSLPMYLGLALEETIARLFVARTGKKVRRSNVWHRHRQFDFIGCHIDYRTIGEPAVVELKTAHSTDGWGPDGSTEIPVHYWIQVQHQLLVLGLSYGYVAALFGHYDFRVYRIERDETFVDGLLATLVEFWHLHVATKSAPPLDGSSAASEGVRRRWPRDTEPEIPATPEQSELVELLVHLRTERSAIESREEELKNRLIDQIGEHGGLLGAGWSVTFKKSKDRQEVNWKAVATAVEPFVPEGDWAAAIKDHTEVKEGSRSFRLNVKEQER